MLSWLLMILGKTSNIVLSQCVRLSIGFVGALSNLSGQITSTVYPTHREIMTDAKSKYGASFNLPPFNVEKKTEEYEIRHYSEANWVSTISSGQRKLLIGHLYFIF